MAASNKQKLKLLYVYRMLMEETDSVNGLSMSRILSKLADEGIQAERKSIYNDLEALRKFGVEVTTHPKCPVEYAVVKNKPTLAEVTLLLDAVQGSKFLTESKSKQLAKTVKNLASTPQRKALDKRVHVEGRIKSQNDSVFHNVDTIHEAIRAHRKVRFLYCRYGTDMELHPVEDEETGDAKLYVHTPVQIIFSNGFYYLAAWSDQHEKVLNFRVDRMRLLQITEEKATRNAAISAYAYEDFAYQAFEMYAGDPMSVTLHVKASGMGVIADRFGRDVSVTGVTTQAGDSPWGGECDVHVTVRMSPLFHGWLASMNDIIELTGPKTAVQAHREWLESLL